MLLCYCSCDDTRTFDIADDIPNLPYTKTLLRATAFA